MKTVHPLPSSPMSSPILATVPPTSELVVEEEPTQEEQEVEDTATQTGDGDGDGDDDDDDNTTFCTPCGEDTIIMTASFL